jgi:hypothetical protein
MLLATSLSMNAVGQTKHDGSRANINSQETRWIEEALRSIETVKVGMTRSDLLVVFREEGGISTPSQRTYVYWGCPYIKVDVKFAAASPVQESPTDKIAEISRPYLKWSVAD